MSKNRDLLKEIRDKRNRLRSDSSRFDEFCCRIDIITEAHDAIVDEITDKRINSELKRYIPISLVSAMEGYFRTVVRDLVDADIAFLERIENFKELKIPLGIVTAVHGRRLTLGEFVSHSVQLSSPDHINKCISNLVDFDFFHTMRESKFDVFPDGVKLIQADDDLFPGVYKIYDLRNIYCHEMAHDHEVTDFDAIWGLFSVNHFVIYSEIMVCAELNRLGS